MYPWFLLPSKDFFFTRPAYFLFLGLPISKEIQQWIKTRYEVGLITRFRKNLLAIESTVAMLTMVKLWSQRGVAESVVLQKDC